MDIVSYLNQIENIRKSFDNDLQSLSIEVTKEVLLNLKNKYLSRNSELNNLLKNIRYLSIENRAQAGEKANLLKQYIETSILNLLDKINQDILVVDPTANPQKVEVGNIHFTSRAIQEIYQIFEKIGFYRVRYPEVEWDWYAFESLNMPKDHPARDEWETFFIDNNDINKTLGKRVLTPHTSSGQVREMQLRKPPIKMMNISKCYRRQMDISHTPMFHQFEGLYVDKNVNIGHLKWTLDYFVKEFFGPERVSRIRPYHFRFTEPSFEVDVSCGVCRGKGCRLCKSGWLEIGGAGMVHPNVLKAGGIDTSIYSGFAFGFGVERNYMMKSGITVDDIRLLYQNDLRILKQF